MPLYRIDAVLPYKSNLPRDVAVNTFHWQIEDFDADVNVALNAAMVTFYNGASGDATHPIAYYLSDYIQRTACVFKVYDAQVPGPPLGVWEWTLGGVENTSSIPFEVAACLSYHSNMTGVPAGRQRGRIYLGPLEIGAMSTHAGTAPTINPNLRASMVGAASELAQNTELLALGAQWVVFSRTNNLAYPITGGWVDDEFDTQRRRQVKATSRDLWVPAA